MVGFYTFQLVGLLVELSDVIGDDDRPLTVRRALREPEFWLLLVAGVCGGFGVSGWVVVPACMAGLLISSLPKYGKLYPRARAVGAEVAFWATVTASVAIAGIAAGAAFGVGQLIWWLWGVV